MDLIGKDPFEENLGEFLNARLKAASWFIDATPDSPILYGAEVSIPVVMHYKDVMHAEQMIVLFKEFFAEYYDKLEVSAMELMAGKDLTISENWKKAPDMMSQFILRMMTDPFYAKYLNEEYPAQETAFGEKMITVWGRGAIYEKLPGKYVMMFTGSANESIQSKDNIFHYANGQNFETIY